MSGGSSRTPAALAGLVCIAAVVAVVLVRSGGEDDPSTPGGPSPEPREACPRPAIGVHSTLAFGVDAARRAAIVEAIDRILGAQVVRDSLLWHRIEPVEGERDWSWLDGVVRELRAAGIEPVLTVYGSPPWANGVPVTTPDHHLHVPPRGAAFDAWLQRYSDFLAEAVERYRDDVSRWEIWNEPNLAMFWRPRPDPAAYRRLYKTLRATILRVDPSAEIAVGGFPGYTATVAPNVRGRAFLRGVTRAGAPLENVAIHPYTDHAPGVHVPGKNNFDDIERVHAQLAAAGERASIWVTEWGWSSATFGERRQARYVDRSLRMLERRYPYVSVATYFVDHDRPPEFLSGLLDENLEPKPAALAFRAHAERLAARCEWPSG